jgi:hypothetical protein
MTRAQVAALAFTTTAIAGLLASASAATLGQEPVDAGAAGQLEARRPAAGECAPVEKLGEGLFSTDKYEWRISFSPSRLQAFWTVSDGFWPFARESSIVTSHWRPGGWTPAEVAPFSGAYTDIDPYITPDGLTLIFSSIRPVNGVARTDTDLWIVRRTWRGWSEPVHLGDNVNGPTDELYASMDLSGTLYFASDRDNGQWDIYRSRRRHNGQFGPAEKLGPTINTPDAWEYNPEISPDGRTLIFASLFRSTNIGLGDLYTSSLRHGQFTPARNLGPCVNTADDEYHPTMLWERNVLIFVRNTGGESGGDFYRTHLRLH